MSLAERKNMKIEEAIKYLRMATDEPWSEKYSDIYKEMCSMSINALEKQIPKKHDVDIFDYGSGYVCGKCGELLLYLDDDDERFRTNYCCHCGQKIDWSVKE